MANPGWYVHVCFFTSRQKNLLQHAFLCPSPKGSNICHRGSNICHRGSEFSERNRTKTLPHSRNVFVFIILHCLRYQYTPVMSYTKLIPRMQYFYSGLSSKHLVKETITSHPMPPFLSHPPPPPQQQEWPNLWSIS